MPLTKTTATGETITITKDSSGDSVKLTDATGTVRWCYVLTRTGEVRGTDIVLTPAEQAQLHAEYAAASAPVATTPVATTPAGRGIRARFAGICKRSGQRYGKGALIEQTRYGWALVGTDVDLGYQMERADSAF